MAKKENTIPTIIDTPEALTAKIAAMKEAQKIFATFTQEQVDKIFKAAATAADKARIPLAKDAVSGASSGPQMPTAAMRGFSSCSRPRRLCCSCTVLSPCPTVR